MSNFKVGEKVVAQITSSYVSANTGGAVLKDSKGNVVGSGAASSAANARANVVAPSGSKVENISISRSGSTFNISFTATEAGTYKVDLTVDGNALGATQVTVVSPIQATMVDQDVDPDWKANFSFSFEGAGEIGAVTALIVKPDGGKVDNTVSKDDAGNWAVKFEAPDAFNLKLFVDGQQVENDFDIDLSG